MLLVIFWCNESEKSAAGAVFVSFYKIPMLVRWDVSENHILSVFISKGFVQNKL